MVSVVLVAAAASAVAAPPAISGKLSKPGYTVIAMTGDQARSVRAAPRRFRLVPPGNSVTLHLRAADGTYAGPVVVGRAGKRAIVGVRAGAKLGKVEVRKGYGKVAKPLAGKWVNAARTARARKGVPIGAGVFGRVRASKTRAAGDPDLDGVPNALDVDDNGNLLLDNFEPRAATGALRASQAELPGAPIYLYTQLIGLPLNETVNASATESLAVADVDDALRRFGRLKLDVLPGDSAELDCGRPQSRTDPTIGGLVYCTRGGTGMKAFYEPTGPFPGPAGGEFDPDGDGRGTLSNRFFLLHGAGSDQIGTGDLLIEQVTAGELTEYPSTLQLVFVTVPALLSFGDNAEPPNAAAVSYPVQGRGADGSPGGPGTQGNPLRVAPGPDGDIVLTLTGVRPQRKAAPGDACLEEEPPCQWVDIGRLTYSFGLNCVDDLPDPDPCALKYCPPGALKSRHPELTRITFGNDTQGGFADAAPDRRASRANAFSFEVNLSECLRDPRGHQLGTRPIPWKAGQEREFFLEASNQLDAANQLIYFTR